MTTGQADTRSERHEDGAHTQEGQTRGPIHVALLMNSACAPRWIDYVLTQITQSTWAELSLVIKTPGVSSSAPTDSEGGYDASCLLFRWYIKLDDRLFSRECLPDALAETLVQPRLAGVETLEVTSNGKPAGGGDQNDLHQAIQRHGIDVVLDIRNGRTTPRLAGAARLGVWTVRPGGSSPVAGVPPAYRQVLQRNGLTASVIERTNDGVNGRALLSYGLCRTDERSMRRNANQACWQSAGLLVRAVRSAHCEDARGAEFTSSVAPGLDFAEEQQAPGNLETARSLMRLAGRAVKSKFVASLYRQRWGIGFKLHPGVSGPFDLDAPFTFAQPPKDRTWADPFVVKRGDRHFVFFEELLFGTNKGRIAFLEIAPSGTWKYGGVVLEHAHHMSYPFLFTWRGDLLMVPEESALRRVQLYRCVSFPDRWELENVLLDDVRAVDATLFRADDFWWMFANVGTGGSSTDAECHLYHASSLTGPWTLHPSSPVKCDPRNARPAGAVFTRSGTLFRPAQDCSQRYGGAISINRVLRLDRSGYAERCVTRIEPVWRRDIVATHTMNSCEGATVVDALFERFKGAP